MSFDINWESLASEEAIGHCVRDFLDKQFNSITLPSFIDKLSVTDFSMGSVPPEIILRHIDDPFPEFYDDSNPDDGVSEDPSPMTHLLSVSDDSSSSEEEDEVTRKCSTKGSISNPQPSSHDIVTLKADSGPSKVSRQLKNYSMNNLGLGQSEREAPTSFFKTNALKSPYSSSVKRNKSVDSSNDIQFVLEVDYRGDIMIEITVDLLVNYPSAKFISLPIKLKIAELEIHSLAVIAYVAKSVYVSFLCDLNSTNTDYFSVPSNHTERAENGSRADDTPLHGGNFVDYTTGNSKERIDVIRKMRIDTEIGEVENNVLKNVGKVEKFLIEQLRNIIREEICWPGWICIDTNDEDEVNSQVSHEVSLGGNRTPDVRVARHCD
ncbi:mitochondrial distribution and morphology protein 12 [Metschnikowia aff. pulcherrima]|uniref:Mitochondrial distribution and morphology protein 12 n=1 Tax=Metschnikowia aff. pulcherrima TaxID=2163413 RepID=A0A4P6XUS6_9ASCO|nr:mitochondrial distribution and morphology protein 12 [Metschnikowia aff. pulcherrima]